MNITHGLRRALQVNPRGVAILEGGRKLTWAEVGERVGRSPARCDSSAWQKETGSRS